MMRMLMMTMMMDVFRHISDRVGGGGEMMTTLCYADTPNNISRRAVLLGIYNTFVMSDHLI